jgi:hypothetical protein
LKNRRPAKPMEIQLVKANLLMQYPDLANSILQTWKDENLTIKEGQNNDTVYYFVNETIGEIVVQVKKI